MFKIEALNPEEEAKTLKFSEHLFHEALKEELGSKMRFHVANDKGEVFDIVYWDNNDDIELLDAYPKYVKPPYMTKYLHYDETDKETLYLDYFKGLNRCIFEELNEYTIVLTKVMLSFTEMEVYCQDERIYWFVAENPRLHIVEELPEDRFAEGTFYIQNEMKCGLEDNNFNRLNSTYAFHNIFFLQWMLNGKDFSNYRFFTLPINDNGGIGAVLSSYKSNQQAAETFGLKFVSPNKDRFGKFPRSLVEKYFAVDIWDPEANEENTLVVPDLIMFYKTKFYNGLMASLDVDSIGDSFRQEMDEYYDAVLGGKKTLGLLIRGSDYISSGLSGVRKMATVEQMTPRIHQWMEEYGYEKLFLATEDADILAAMRKEFGRKVVALSQQRLSVKNLRDGQIISEYEKETGGEDYAAKLEDTTINYFYALYILSRCDAFLCSGQCNGWDNVLSLNGGKFERSYKFTVGVTGDPVTEDWKEIKQVTAGMFARAAYPSDKAFFMTYRFDLAEAVDPDALKQAWDKTLIVYPYMRYAVVSRNNRLLLTENPLPFVIKETGEIVEPFERSGNFHMVTFCYLGRTLWVYIDHVPVDGTGINHVFETFFYHYYCLVDGREYPVPEGVFTEKDGPVPGLDVDGYLMADVVDPTTLAGSMMGEKSFVPPEFPKEGVFGNRPDCRGYCLSVPSTEMMACARSVGGSPVSVLSVALAKAVCKVHSENEQPIKIMYPANIRKVMGNNTSLVHQAVFAQYRFEPSELAAKSDSELNAAFRAYLKEFTSEPSIRMNAGIFRGMCEGYAKAFAYGALDKVCMEQRKNADASFEISYVGTLHTGGYGSRIRMTAFHAMPEKGVMLQVTEVGDAFCIDWYQGFHDADYIRAMRDEMAEMGMKGLRIERVE
ncbi:MAG: hypothetical protein IJU50_04265 [Lachnospiraceae bacterium]|nr:hypothetical protein [Lachnospiraceae bacterium]